MASKLTSKQQKTLKMQKVVISMKILVPGDGRALKSAAVSREQVFSTVSHKGSPQQFLLPGRQLRGHIRVLRQKLVL